MKRRGISRRGLGTTAIWILALVVLAAGLCLMDGAGDRSPVEDLCLVALLVPTVVLIVVGLLPPRGPVVSLGPPAPVPIFLSVPDPVPRLARLA